MVRRTAPSARWLRARRVPPCERLRQRSSLPSGWRVPALSPELAGDFHPPCHVPHLCHDFAAVRILDAGIDPRELRLGRRTDADHLTAAAILVTELDRSALDVDLGCAEEPDAAP